ncbi:hypothetical protein [Tolypothrix bouteillei]|nr:hypothetical protein [Tolypothrix bouteillei]
MAIAEVNLVLLRSPSVVSRQRSVSGNQRSLYLLPHPLPKIHLYAYELMPRGGNNWANEIYKLKIKRTSCPVMCVLA